jgi:hypothetical protein
LTSYPPPRTLALIIPRPKGAPLKQSNVKIEGIRKAGSEWAVVGSRPGQSVVPGRSPRIVTLVEAFSGPGAKAAAIRRAGTNRLAPDNRAIMFPEGETA